MAAAYVEVTAADSWCEVCQLTTEITTLGRRNFPNDAPKAVSRNHVEVFLDDGVVMVRRVSQNAAHLMAAGSPAVALSHELAVPLPEDSVISLDKSHQFRARVVRRREVPAPAAEATDPADAVIDLSSSDEDDGLGQAEATRVMPGGLGRGHAPSAEVILIDEGSPLPAQQQQQQQQQQPSASGKKRQKHGALTGDPVRPAAHTSTIAGSSSAATSSASRAPPVEVIDLEAAVGSGIGVSGKPLLPGEQLARQQRKRRSWVLHASRSTDDTPEEQHYRFAESAYCRGGGMAASISSVEYHFHPELEAAWHAKKREYDERFGVHGHTVLFAFHGTRSTNVKSILSGGFKLSKVGSTTDAGYYGAGIYFSEHLGTSIGYNAGNHGMLICKLLVGKPYLCSNVQHGRGLQRGFTSHVADASGSEVIIFDEAAMLPVYVVVTGGQQGGKGRGRGRGAVQTAEGLKGLEGGRGGGAWGAGGVMPPPMVPPMMVPGMGMMAAPGMMPAMPFGMMPSAPSALTVQDVANQFGVGHLLGGKGRGKSNSVLLSGGRGRGGHEHHGGKAGRGRGGHAHGGADQAVVLDDEDDDEDLQEALRRSMLQK